jgi:sec-independent protein translocase protein TatB
MLPGLGFSEILVIGVIALLVVGPKDLPLMLRKLGRWMARMRGMAQEFRSGFDELARQAELDELRREVDALRRGNVLGSGSNVVNDIRDEIQKPVAPAQIPAPFQAPTPATAEANAEPIAPWAQDEAEDATRGSEPRRDDHDPEHGFDLPERGVRAAIPRPHGSGR